jgi:predicted amidohydrolase
MKITLVQLDANWCVNDLPRWLISAPCSDLIVFPECYPFEREAGIAHDTAKKRLEAVAQQVLGRTFIAGGYVYEKGLDGARILRNRVYLVHQGFVVDYYDKQIVWEKEKFTPSNIVKLFAWGEHRCLPLICADADSGPKSDFMNNLILRAKAAGAGSNVPIVVSSFGAMLMKPYWTDSLHHLSDQCQAPVLICGIAGKSEHTFHYPVKDGGDDKDHPFGGGGSGLFIPGNQESKQYAELGYITVDLATLETRRKKFA